MNKNFKQEFFSNNDEGPIFMGAKRVAKNCNIGIYGVPYDGTTSFRPGTRFGPDSIRSVSSGLETFCPQLNLDLETLNFVDFGLLDIPYGAPQPVIERVTKVTNQLLANNIKPLMLGGEHSITIGAIHAIATKYPEIIIIQLDAHADLRNEWMQSKYNHACVIRRCLDIIPSNQILQVGIRSGTKNEFEDLQNNNRLIKSLPGKDNHKLRNALKPHKGKPIYLTIDLDWFDPAILPGTGTPEPGGFSWNDFANIIQIIKDYNIIGGDIVELSPQLDTSGISSILAAKVTRSLIMLMHQTKLIQQ